MAEGTIDNGDLGTGGTTEPPVSSADRVATLYPDDVPAADDGDDKPRADRSDQRQEDKPADESAAEYRLTMPDGVALDQELLGEATPVLRDIGLSNDQANKLVPLVPVIQDRIYQQQQDDFSAVKADWAKAVQADPNIGGKNWKETERLAAIALNAGGAGPGSEARELLDESGLGNHPAFVKLFRTLGHRLAGTKGRGGSGRSRAEILYPDDVPKSGMGAN